MPVEAHHARKSGTEPGSVASDSISSPGFRARIACAVFAIGIGHESPFRSSVALIVSQPLHFVAYVVLGLQPLDAFSWALTAVGFIACSVAILHTPDSDWDLAPEPRRSASGS